MARAYTTIAARPAWPLELDSVLRGILSEKRGDEPTAIYAARQAHPELPEDLIWDRIVYLRLTKRVRPPYHSHQWTELEDGILQQEYGRTRASSTAAINQILALHPDWTRDAVVWRAHVLGVARHQTDGRRGWSTKLDYQLLSLAGLPLRTIAKRLGRSEKSIVGRLRRLGRNAEFFGGYKIKDLVADLRVPESRVKRWLRLGWLERKEGRITEESLRALCRYHPEEIPFHTLTPETQTWLKLSMGYGRKGNARSGGS